MCISMIILVLSSFYPTSNYGNVQYYLFTFGEEIRESCIFYKIKDDKQLFKLGSITTIAWETMWQFL